MVGQVIDSEIERLNEHLETFNLDELEQERRQAMNIALFDPTPLGNLARKYEANAERQMQKALKEAQRISDESPRSEFVDPYRSSLSESTTSGMGSFFPTGPTPESRPATPRDPKPSDPRPKVTSDHVATSDELNGQFGTNHPDRR